MAHQAGLTLAAHLVLGLPTATRCSYACLQSRGDHLISERKWALKLLTLIPRRSAYWRQGCPAKAGYWTAGTKNIGTAPSTAISGGTQTATRPFKIRDTSSLPSGNSAVGAESLSIAAHCSVLGTTAARLGCPPSLFSYGRIFHHLVQPRRALSSNQLGWACMPRRSRQAVGSTLLKSKHLAGDRPGRLQAAATGSSAGGGFSKLLRGWGYRSWHRAAILTGFVSRSGFYCETVGHCSCRYFRTLCLGDIIACFRLSPEKE